MCPCRQRKSHHVICKEYVRLGWDLYVCSTLQVWRRYSTIESNIIEYVKLEGDSDTYSLICRCLFIAVLFWKKKMCLWLVVFCLDVFVSIHIVLSYHPSGVHPRVSTFFLRARRYILQVKSKLATMTTSMAFHCSSPAKHPGVTSAVDTVFLGQALVARISQPNNDTSALRPTAGLMLLSGQYSSQVKASQVATVKAPVLRVMASERTRNPKLSAGRKPEAQKMFQMATPLSIKVHPFNPQSASDHKCSLEGHDLLSSHSSFHEPSRTCEASQGPSDDLLGRRRLAWRLLPGKKQKQKRRQLVIVCLQSKETQIISFCYSISSQLRALTSWQCWN